MNKYSSFIFMNSKLLVYPCPALYPLVTIEPVLYVSVFVFCK